MDTTLSYYDENAESFAKGTLFVDFTETQERFLKKIPKNGKILDFGCGAGRDTKYFLEHGYDVSAIDGSGEMCRIAGMYTGISVRKLCFQELNDKDTYDGIWACSSILHLPKPELKAVLLKTNQALKKHGIMYTSFKYGDFEGFRDGRYFTDFTEETFREFARDILCFLMEECWITKDARPGREKEKWLNLILRKN